MIKTISITLILLMSVVSQGKTPVTAESSFGEFILKKDIALPDWQATMERTFKIGSLRDKATYQCDFELSGLRAMTNGNKPMLLKAGATLKVTGGDKRFWSLVHEKSGHEFNMSCKWVNSNLNTISEPIADEETIKAIAGDTFELRLKPKAPTILD